jgi:hypothetical protein
LKGKENKTMKATETILDYNTLIHLSQCGVKSITMNRECYNKLCEGITITALSELKLCGIDIIVVEKEEGK